MVKTINETLRDPDSKFNDYTSKIGKDIIRGWNDRRLASNVNLSSLVPFVQLIGIFNEKELKLMLGGEEGTKPVYFSPHDNFAGGDALDYSVQHAAGVRAEASEPPARIGQPNIQSATQRRASTAAWIEENLEKRFINLHLFEGRKATDDSDALFTLNKQEGIVMAEYTSQAGGVSTASGDPPDSSRLMDAAAGGIGITDLQVEYGKSNSIGSRKLNMRITINDPAMLNERPEYAKLSNMTGEFLIIYGWSNPQIIEGFNATPPPILMPDPSASPAREMMIVPVENLDTGGYWSAVKLNVVSYDFSFNEMGQLEVNCGFMDKTAMNLASTRVAEISGAWRAIMAKSDYDPTTGAQPNEDITQLTVTDSNGNEVLVSDLVYNDQNKNTPTGSDPVEPAPGTDILSARSNRINIDEAVANIGSQGLSWSSNQGEWNQQAYWDMVKRRERLGFPYGGVGIRSYEAVKTYTPVNTGMPEIPPVPVEGEDPAVRQMGRTETKYKVKVVYYYLGWVLEAMKLALNETNRSRVRSGEKAFNPHFQYLNNEDDSQLKTSFQEKVTNTERGGNMEERIQNAIIRLKTYCMPPSKVWEDRPGNEGQSLHKPIGGMNVSVCKNEAVAGKHLTSRNSGRYEGDRRQQIEGAASVLGGMEVTDLHESIVRKVYPTPAGTAALPYRGHIYTLNPATYADGFGLTDSEKSTPAFHVFVPDWYQTEDIDPDAGARPRQPSAIPAGGSPDGYNPFAPTNYKAADRGGRFFYRVLRPGGRPLQASGSPDVIGLYEVDAYRYMSRELWSKTQRQWGNRHRRFLDAYFEHVIRERIKKLRANYLANGGKDVEFASPEPDPPVQAPGLAFVPAAANLEFNWDFGVPEFNPQNERHTRIEQIYNEPVDLDFLTSKVFNFRMVSQSIKNRQDAAVWPGLANHERWVPSGWPPGGSNSRGGAKALEPDPDIIFSIKRTTRQLEERKDALALAEETMVPLRSTYYNRGVTEDLQSNTEKSNSYKRELEELTGGKYEISQNAAADEYLTSFTNWKKVGRGPVSPTDGRFTPIPLWEDQSGVPEVKLEWLIWKNYSIPTDNFSGRDGEDAENRQAIWISENPRLRARLIADRASMQKEVNDLLTAVARTDSLVTSLNNQWITLRERIRDLEIEIPILEERLEKLGKFVSSSGEEFQEKELSLYVDADASEFDDVLEVDMGRSMPMLLETKVAQQWWRRLKGLGQHSNWINGVQDVSNYGVSVNNQSWYGTNLKARQFTFNSEHEGLDIQGHAKIILDMEVFKSAMEIAGKLPPSPSLSDYSGGALDPEFQAKLSHRREIATSYAKDYGISSAAAANAGSWPILEMFGNPGQPNVDGANDYGFTPGVTEMHDRYGNVGGNHCATYIEFLALFGLRPPSYIIGTSGSSPTESSWLAAAGIEIPGSLEGNYLPFDLWPTPSKTNRLKSEAREASTGVAYEDTRRDDIDEYYYMIDDANNIVRLAGDVGRSFERTGWSLTNPFTRQVYLYPSYQRAIQVDPETDQMIAMGNSVNHRRGIDAANRGAVYSPGESAADASGSTATGVRSGYVKLDADEHNIKLTLDEKRSMVVSSTTSRGAQHDPFTSLGRSVPGAAGVGTKNLHYDEMGAKIRRRGQLVYEKGEYNTVDNDGNPAGVVIGKELVNRSVGGPIGPGYLRRDPYTNDSFPYGTGWYHTNWRQPNGSVVAPSWGDDGDSPGDIDYTCIGDFLEQLPGRGMFERVNNKNYSPTTIAGDGTIVNGEQLDPGFIKFVVQNVFALLGKNRRIMCRSATGILPPDSEIEVVGNNKRRDRDGYRCTDVTYGHLFRPVAAEEAVETGPEISFTNFALKNIVSVADIPIRRDIVDNIINKNNTNMSLEQMMGELLQPSALGIDTGNIHVQCREKASGGFEIFQASKNWEAVANQADEEQLATLFQNKFPSNHFLLDYKHADSLIENLDLSCKYDPAIGLTFQRNAAAFAGNPDAIIQFLSYEGVAEEFRQFLETEGKSNPEDAAAYAQVFSQPASGTFDDESRIEIHRQAFFDVSDSKLNGGKKLVPDNVMSAFLQQQPARAQKLSALIQSEPGQNFATQLLANYMRTLTVTIHGTTNLSPFNSINVSGVLPSLEGLYLITGVRESITLSNFQTILEGILVRQRPMGNVREVKHNYGKAESSDTGPK